MSNLIDSGINEKLFNGNLLKLKNFCIEKGYRLRLNYEDVFKMHTQTGEKTAYAIEVIVYNSFYNQIFSAKYTDFSEDNAIEHALNELYSEMLCCDEDFEELINHLDEVTK